MSGAGALAPLGLRAPVPPLLAQAPGTNSDIVAEASGPRVWRGRVTLKQKGGDGWGRLGMGKEGQAGQGAEGVAGRQR